MSRLVFLNRYFFPDHSATSQILGDLAFHLAAAGADVHVVTSRQIYDDPRALLAEEEMVNGVKVHRVDTSMFGRSSLLGRAFDYASCLAAMWSRTRSLISPGDILVAKTDPPLACLPAMAVARGKNARLVNWLQDIYPETAAALGVPLMNGPAGWTLARLRDVSLRQALANVVPGEGMAKRICARGAPRHRVHVIHNWVGDEQIRPVPVAENPLRRAWELQDKFVVAYSGNLGRAHDFDTVLRAAKLVRHRTQILFLFIGGGHSFDQLKRAVKQQNLCGTFTFVPYQPADVLKYSLGVADVHLISLKAALEGLVVPSKFYGIAAAGKPVIAIAAADGEIARLVRAYSCGLIIEPGNGDTLAERLVQLSQDPVRVADMGRRARAMLEDRFTRKQALARWQLLLSELQDTSRAVIDRSDSE